MVCGCSHVEKESLSDAQCEIPFGKETIREIRFIYWVKVREPGTYDGIVDSGIRKRIFIMTDQTYIEEHLKVFNITKITPDSDNTPVSGEIIFVNKDGQEWQADFLNEKNTAFVFRTTSTFEKTQFFLATVFDCARSRMRTPRSGF